MVAYIYKRHALKLRERERPGSNPSLSDLNTSSCKLSLSFRFELNIFGIIDFCPKYEKGKKT
jgi:hypothetical protein